MCTIIKNKTGIIHIDEKYKPSLDMYDYVLRETGQVFPTQKRAIRKAFNILKRK